jgi:hypothetical protein
MAQAEIDDGGWEEGLPYALYLMFMIERVTGLRFPKDGMHIVYKIEKTQPAAASQAVGGGVTPLVLSIH